jgi:GTP-binding protein Era
VSEKTHKSGFVSIIGKPNAGKSTLMNALVGAKLAIATPKAQTTRHRILGIANDEDYQIVFSDTPGVILPQYRLHRAMMSQVHHSLEDADLMIILVDVNEKFPEEEVFKIARKSKIPKILVINKVDKSDQEKVKARYEQIKEQIEFDQGIGISALHGFNMLELKKMIVDALPEGPPYFDKDSISDRPERFFVAELVREKIFLFLRDEVPYSTQVTILDFEEKDGVDVIHAEIHVERDSQKAILIGKKGVMIQKIGAAARKDIEAFLDKRIYLDLHVRVTENWKDSKFHLRSFGFGE